MRRLLFAVIGLLALFTIIRAYTEDAGGRADAGGRYVVQPGLLEFQGAEGGVRVAFGFLERAESDGAGRTWNLFPLRLLLRAGKQEFLIALNGLSLVGPGGVRVGEPVTIRGVKRGDVVSIGGEVTVQGSVEGDVWALGADVKLLAGSTVAGDVVALGGTVLADRRAVIRGNKQSLPNLKIPFIGLLGSEHSAATFRFLVQILGVLLFLLALFVFVHFRHRDLIGLSGVLASRWRGVLLYLVVALLALPVTIALLAASILGIVIIPLLAVVLLLLAYAGFVATAVRLGFWMRGRGEEGGAYTAGLLGLLALKGPVLLGILLSLLDGELLRGTGRFLAGLGSVAVYLAALYGFGGALQYLRRRGEAASHGT